MGKKTVEVTFETITPLWTGNAWQENKEVRPSSIFGGLRFWFSLYWYNKTGSKEKLNNNGIPDENLRKLENLKEGRTFKNLFKEEFLETNNLDEATDKALEKLGLTVPSRIFGCTGWKSRVKLIIKDYESTTLNIDNIETKYPFSKDIPINTTFWIKKLIFRNSKEVSAFQNIKMTLITTDYWWNKYLKNFFCSIKNQILLIGGKNSFGFGFTRIYVNFIEEKNTIENDNSNWDNELLITRIPSINYEGSKTVLGFNFKYFLRKKEEKKYRKLIFGDKGVASKIYVSNLLTETLCNKSDKCIYLLALQSPYMSHEKKVKDLDKRFEKYKNLLLELSKDKGDGKIRTFS